MPKRNVAFVGWIEKHPQTVLHWKDDLFRLPKRNSLRLEYLLTVCQEVFFAKLNRINTTSIILREDKDNTQSQIRGLRHGAQLHLARVATIHLFERFENFF